VPQPKTAIDVPARQHESFTKAAPSQLEHFGTRRGVPVQWWYYNGHLSSVEQKFSFHVAFFRFDAAGFRIGRWIPLRLLGRTVSFAHFSLTNHQLRTTRFSHRRAFRWGSHASTASLDVRIKDWGIRGDSDEHQISVGFDDCRLQLNLELAKPVVSYGSGGLFESVLPRAASHFSCPRMQVDGFLQLDGKQDNVKGTAWMDREYGEVGPDETVLGWVWMSIQLNDGREMMIYRMDRRDRSQSHLRAAIIEQSGEVRILGDDEIAMHATKTWRSEATEAEYPIAWTLRVPAEGLELRLEALFDAVEFDTRGTTSTVYWEGPATVRGTSDRERVAGNAFIEIVGQEKTRMTGHIDHARRNLPLLGYFANEMRFRLLGTSRYRIQHG
jgi:predicted secreted hydrolase